jgi:hypothetical protein
MGGGQRDRCLVNGHERGGAEVARGLDSRRDSLKSREKFGAAAASLKPSVRVTISVGLGLAQQGRGRRRCSVGDGSGGGVAARDSRLGARERCFASESWVGRWSSAGSGSSGDSQQLTGRRRLCPVGQSGLCGALRKVGRLCHRASVWAVGAGSRGWVGRGRNETSGRSVGGEHESTIPPGREW